MSKVKSRNTNIELLLRRALFRKGYRFRLHYRISGTPDIVLPSKKIAIFCDGDFWHGKHFKRENINYKKFWKNKIKANIIRDKKVNTKLRKDGWKVIRFWKSEILKNLDRCVDTIEQTLEKLNNSKA